MSQLSGFDQEQLLRQGTTRQKVQEQIDTFKEGIPFVHLEKAAVVGEGIVKLTVAEEDDLVALFESTKGKLSLLKFVPASGAASRMFKAMFNFLEEFRPSEQTMQDYLEKAKDKDIKVFVNHYVDFPFYKIVQHRIAGKTDDNEVYSFVRELLSEKGLNYGFFPKGLLPFHNYGDYAATPFEEHLREAALYSTAEDTAQLHFTISEQHGEMFNEEFANTRERVSYETKTSFKVGYSYQKTSTDTIAVDMDNQPFRNLDGSLLFRPGGHGALIENLNQQDADIIFIKNIDNVVVKDNLEKVSQSKKVLAGLLLKVQKKAFEYAETLESNVVSEDLMAEIKTFLEKELNSRFPDTYSGYSSEERIAVLKDKLNRPIRVCGMVKNEGEPGGGPFWTSDTLGHVSLQIIESAQVDMEDPGQVRILRNSTHFNPVDLVCGIKDYKGEKYDLSKFIDYKQGFITQKTKDGKELKALELPGLWNGAMAFWNTIFVEVPSYTFNPVKTVNDLLKPSHRAIKPI